MLIISYRNLGNISVDGVADTVNIMLNMIMYITIEVILHNTFIPDSSKMCNCQNKLQCMLNNKYVTKNIECIHNVKTYMHLFL